MGVQCAGVYMHIRRAHRVYFSTLCAVITQTHVIVRIRIRVETQKVHCVIQFLRGCSFLLKKFNLCHKLKFSNVFIFPTRWCKYFKLNYGDLTEFIDCNSSVPEFKEFERRFKFKPRFKYGWFQLKLYQIFQDLSRCLI